MHATTVGDYSAWRPLAGFVAFRKGRYAPRDTGTESTVLIIAGDRRSVGGWFRSWNARQLHAWLIDGEVDRDDASAHVHTQL